MADPNWRTKRTPLVTRFWKKVQKGKPNECWLWQATKGGRYVKKGRGYGYISPGGKTKKGNSMVAAHRVSWVLHFGPIPGGLHVLHSCDNPACVNPSHLFLGTNLDNIKDKISKNRHLAGYRKFGADMVIAIRADTGTYRVIAGRHGVSAQTVSDIRNRKTWKYL